jgi:hypothetical protein
MLRLQSCGWQALMCGVWSRLTDEKGAPTCPARFVRFYGWISHRAYPWLQVGHPPAHSISQGLRTPMRNNLEAILPAFARAGVRPVCRDGKPAGIEISESLPAAPERTE